MAGKWPRLIALSAAVLILAGMLAMQAASSVLTRKQPVLAVALFPNNGAAQEQLALLQFMGGVTKAEDIVPSATAASAAALAAFDEDPLSPKSFAILAMAQQDPAKKGALLTAATAINRRDLLLQGLVLEERIARQDYAATLETLDMLLRVHPEQKANFFPILLKALDNDAALPALAGILDQTSDWQSEFFDFAARQPSVLVNLAQLRLGRKNVSTEVDQRLISGLAKSGQISEAYQVYRKASDTPALAAGNRALIGWTSEFPPFDWDMADKAGFRAQQSITQGELDVFVRSGKGGVLASRNLAMPPGPFTLRIKHALSPADQVNNVRLQLSCPGNETPFYDEPLRAGMHDYRSSGAPGGCDFITFALTARAWSGSPSIKGTISKLELVRD